ncbi:MAG: ATP-binding protein, partial [Solirubrobacteraceae bacterium]
RRLAREYGTEHPLAMAAQRALAASRGAIVDLEAADAPSTEAALCQVSAELAARFSVDVKVSVAEDGADDHSDADRREIVRIAREAVANAARHGGARHVSVNLGSRASGVLLRVIDDGCGFGAASAHTAGTGLGMRTMRERADYLGAELITGDSRPGRTVLDVVPR